MILHGFAWRSSKSFVLFDNKTLYLIKNGFGPDNSRKLQKKSFKCSLNNRVNSMAEIMGPNWKQILMPGPDSGARDQIGFSDCSLRQGARPLKGTYKGDVFTFFFIFV